MPLNRIKPYAPPHDDIECFEWTPPLTEHQKARFRTIIELRRLKINGRFAQLRPLVGETDKPELL